MICSMSANALFGNKKRNSSILYDGHQGRVTMSSAFRGSCSQRVSGGHGDNFPPNKRYRSIEITELKRIEDPFGDNEDFTADDLEEIDILATQALTQIAGIATDPGGNEQNKTLQSTQHLLLPSHANQKTLDNCSGTAACNATKSTKEPLENSTENVNETDVFGFEVLRAQYKELMQKFSELQKEIMMKNGEIKVLRDSLRQMESSLEQEKKNHLLLEKERSQVQSEKEKELLKKLKSLQSELHFKDAEMNELRIKLQNCERMNKPVPVLIPYISPKKSPLGIVKTEGCSSPQTEKNCFPTKESFIADSSPKAAVSTVQLLARTPLKKEDMKAQCLETKQVEPEIIQRDVSYSPLQRQNTQGSILLNALMKQPKTPGSLGLYHLLSSSSDPLPGFMLQQNVLNFGSTGACSIKANFPKGETPLSSLREAQKLAITGLNLIAMDEGLLQKNVAEDHRDLFQMNKLCKLSGAVHLLPLVEHHIGIYCHALQAVEKSGTSPSENQSLSSSSTLRSLVSSTDDLFSSLENTALASLGILYYLVSYSQEVVYTLLSSNIKRDTVAGDILTLEMEKTQAYINQDVNETSTPRPQEAIEAQTQHPLFKRLLQLLDFPIVVVSCQRIHAVNQSLRVLVELAGNATDELLFSFQDLLSGTVLLRCLSTDSPLSTVHLAVQLLTICTDHPLLTAQLFSHSETCIFLALYLYITSRSDKLASEKLWLLLEEEVVRFLTKLGEKCPKSYAALVDSTCQCSHEIIKALIIMLHRQWLNVRRRDLHSSVISKKTYQFLRDLVLLLHRLCQRGKAYHEHCLEVLHQYDQVLPGLRTIFKHISDLKEIEEMAVDELCPPDPEIHEQDMDCDKQ